jgi:hypothetical protein
MVNDENSRIQTGSIGQMHGSKSGSIGQMHGSAHPDPDPQQNVMDPQHSLVEYHRTWSAWL